MYVFSNSLPLSVDGVREGPPSVSLRTSGHPELVRPVLLVLSEAEGSEVEGSHATDRRTDLLFWAFDGCNDKIPRYARNDNSGVISPSILSTPALSVAKGISEHIQG